MSRDRRDELTCLQLGLIVEGTLGEKQVISHTRNLYYDVPAMMANSGLVRFDRFMTATLLSVATIGTTQLPDANVCSLAEGYISLHANATPSLAFCVRKEWT